jgi:hypothetical protein
MKYLAPKYYDEGLRPTRELTDQQKEALSKITRPQILEDMYLSMTGQQSVLPPSRKTSVKPSWL